MKNKMVKTLLMAGCLTICVAATLGIHKTWYREPEQKSFTEMQMDAEPELSIKVEPVQEESNEVREPVKEEPLVIQPEPVTEVKSRVQELQPEPEKTEAEKPEEPPALMENKDITNPSTPPAYAEQKEPAPVKETPTHGATKDGMIYIDGFGWIPNKGGGGSGRTAEDMFENGNKVGAMG